MKRYKFNLFSILLSIILFGACNNNDSFDNKVFNTSNARVSTLLIKKNVINAERILQAAIAQPANHDISIDYKVDRSLLDIYNQAYYDKAVLLPEEHYNLSEAKVVIVAGGTRSTEAKILFKSINELNRDLVYVLPITISNANMDILQSARTNYYVFRKGAIINVVADMEKNYLHIDKWTRPEVANKLEQITIETLIKARDYDRLISSVMGIEGIFLLRIGDSDRPSNQIQLATGSGNFPKASADKGLPLKEWIHIAATYDSKTGKAIIYVDGKVQSESGVKDEPFLRMGTIDLTKQGKDGFYIGYSYNNDRFLAGEFSECRIWNVIRTQEEIANNIYEVDPKEEGLVAYWKCDEGEGNEVKDQTGNGNHLKSKEKIKWTSVNLPE